MCRKDGVEFYKHVETRRYLLLDSESRCYRQADAGGFVEADFEQELRVASGVESRPVLERQLAGELDRKTEELTAMNGTEQTIAIRTWICEASAQRVGQTWREEDHAALVRNMRAADRLTVQLVDFASERAVQTALQTVQREDLHGSRSEVEPSRAGLALRGD